MQLTNDRKEQLSWSTCTLLYAAGKMIYKTREPYLPLSPKRRKRVQCQMDNKPDVKGGFCMSKKCKTTGIEACLCRY